MEELGTADVMAALAAAAGADPYATWQAGGEALARYGIADRPPDEGPVGTDAGFEERAAEIAAADGGHRRAVPQAVLEWSGGRATPGEAGFAAGICVGGGRGPAAQMVIDMGAAPASRGPGGRPAAGRNAGRDPAAWPRGAQGARGILRMGRAQGPAAPPAGSRAMQRRS